MRRVNLSLLTVPELVERFTACGLDQFNAQWHGNIGKYNCLYDEAVRIKDELARRPGDERTALVPLFDHPNPQVRLNSAQWALAVAPVAARAALQILWDRKEFPQAAHARQSLMALDEGTSRLI